MAGAGLDVVMGVCVGVRLGVGFVATMSDAEAVFEVAGDPLRMEADRRGQRMVEKERWERGKGDALLL